MTSGWRKAISMSAFAGPEGLRRPYSHSCNVRAEICSTSANSIWVRPVLPHASATSLGSTRQHPAAAACGSRLQTDRCIVYEPPQLPMRYRYQAVAVLPKSGPSPIRGSRRWFGRCESWGSHRGQISNLSPFQSIRPTVVANLYHKSRC